MKRPMLRTDFIILTVIMATSQLTWANSVHVRPSLVTCEPELTTGKALKIIQTNYEPPRGSHGFSLSHIIPNLNDFVTFSPDGRYALVRHIIFPTGEHISVVNTQTGELSAGKTWVSQERFYGTFWSVGLDDQLTHLIVWGGNQRADGLDHLASWDLISNQENRVTLRPLDGSNEASRSARYMTYRSPISAEHPYYLRFHFKNFDEATDKAVFVAEIGNYQTGKTLKLSDIFYDTLSTPVLPFQASHRFTAIPSRDGHAVNIISFAELEEKMNSSDENATADDSLKFRPLVHEQLVRRVVPVSHAPLVVTSTQDHIFVWNIATGQVISRMDARSPEFVVLDHMRAIAYKTNDGKLALFSYLANEMIGTFEKAPEQSVASMVDSWQNGVAYISDKDGHLSQIIERYDSGRATYEINNTGFELSSDELYRTVLRHGDHFYLVTAAIKPHPDLLITKDLTVKIYSWDSKKVVATKAFPGDGDLVMKMDPSRRKILFSSSKREIGFLDLEKLLFELGL